MAGVDRRGELVTYFCEGTTAGGLLIVRSDPAAGAASAVELATSYPVCDDTALNAAPTASQLGAAWSFGFAGVLIVYLVAWSCGRVLDVIGWR